jgi:hypothetical protein
MALQLPALRSIGDSIGVDFSSAVSSPPVNPASGDTQTKVVTERKAGAEPEHKRK